MKVNLLKGALAIRGISIKELGEKSGINKSALYRKLKGKSEFSRKEIEKIANVLKLTSEEMNSIFFDL